MHESVKDLDIYKTALELVPHPCAFVCNDHKFVYINNAWSKLLGYSESELIGTRWQDITKVEHIGGDQMEADKIRDGEQTEFFTEKTYLTKVGATVNVALYVHRYPAFGPQKGYIAFAKQKTKLNNDIEFLKRKYRELEQAVMIFSSDREQSQTLMEKIGRIENKVDGNKADILSIAMGNKMPSINVGDQNSNAYNRDSNNNSSTTNSTTLIVGIMGIIGSVLVSMGAVIAYVVYATNNNPDVAPPNIDQRVISQPVETGE